MLNKLRSHYFDSGDEPLSSNNPPTQPELGSVISNAFGEHCLFAINRNAFQESDASSVFRSHFGNTLFEENTFYVIAGSDSGLLYQYIKAQGLPKNSRYMLVELDQVLEHLIDMHDPQGKLVITTEDNWQTQATAEMDMLDYAMQDRLVLIRSLGVVHAHYNQYLPFWRKIREEFELLIRNYKIGLNNRPFTHRQLENLAENQVPAICLKDTFQGKTAVVLAGGPSLDQLLPWVKLHRQDLLVIAVSRISHSLLQAGIQPDISVSVDPYHINMNVSLEMFEFQDGTLLVNEYHLNSILLSSWGGLKAFTGKRYPWSTVLEPENIATTIGNTVTNTAFGLAIEAGVKQLILGGADFCFSQTGHTHASGSAEHALGPQPMHGDSRVETNGGLMADTNSTFINSSRSIDLQAKIAVSQGCRVINPTPDAMRLPHIEYLPINNIKIEPLGKPARETIAGCLPDDNNSARTHHYMEILGEVDRVLEELRIIKTLSSKALNYNDKLFNKKEQGSNAHYNTKLDNIEKKLDGKYASTVKFIKHYGLSRLTPLLRQVDQDTEELKEQNRLYFQALIDTINELMELLPQVRKRTLSRVEEEKIQPDMQQLLEQWRNDQQPGRAIQWAKRHADCVNQLPEKQQQSLRIFQNSFDESVENFHRYYLEDIERGVKLDGVDAKAREYFQHHDESGLHSLLTALEDHRDTEDANQFVPLVQGYLAELRNETTLAIEIYQSITTGPTQIDALTRLFELHTKQHDLGSALEVLKTLSGISPIYTPMYADMLQGTGNVESAVETYTDYLLTNPNDLNSVMKLGKIYHQHGSIEGLEWAMNYILSKDPGNQAAKAMLNSLVQS